MSLKSDLPCAALLLYPLLSSYPFSPKLLQQLPAVLPASNLSPSPLHSSVATGQITKDRADRAILFEIFDGSLLPTG